MKTNDINIHLLTEILKQVPSDISGVYVVDSNGSMLANDVKKYTSCLKELFPVVGYHGHNNLGLANSNSITAIESGANIIDGTLHGIGRGSCNAATEELAAILITMNRGDFFIKELAKLADNFVKNVNIKSPSKYKQILGAILSIHSSHFHLINELSNKYMIDNDSLMAYASKIAKFSVNESHIKLAATVLKRQR